MRQQVTRMNFWSHGVDALWRKRPATIFFKASVARMQRDASSQRSGFAQMRRNIGDVVPPLQKIGRAL
jgi:hypothetical protein